MNNNSKELVTLRRRETKNGGASLFLDYAIDGVRTREFLKMYLVPEHGKLDKIKNNETLKLAEAMKAKRILQLQEGRTDIRTRRREDVPLTNFLEGQRGMYELNNRRFYVLAITKILNWLKKYGRKTTLLTIDKNYILDFCRFMGEGGLGDGSVYLFYAVLHTLFRKAYRAGMLNRNPFDDITAKERPQKQETERDYLSLDEVKALMSTHCKNRMTERAFLFSCFTGLRISDIESLTWDQIRDNGQGLQVETRQVKTQKVVYIPLSANAISQLPPAKKKEGLVFTLPCRSSIANYLGHWTKVAGIAKHITFHCARHTYATLLLTYGANIYTVSALLGHTNVKTTQIYAKIVDENKRKTVDLIPVIGES